MISIVLLFNQPMTATAESHMQVVTQELVDAALVCGGRYYLPYRLAATAQQFAQAFPQAQEFFSLKRHYDPGELFQNEMYVKYASKMQRRPARAALY